MSFIKLKKYVQHKIQGYIHHIIMVQSDFRMKSSYKNWFVNSPFSRCMMLNSKRIIDFSQISSISSTHFIVIYQSYLWQWEANLSPIELKLILSVAFRTALERIFSIKKMNVTFFHGFSVLILFTSLKKCFSSILSAEFLKKFIESISLNQIRNKEKILFLNLYLIIVHDSYVTSTEKQSTILYHIQIWTNEFHLSNFSVKFVLVYLRYKLMIMIFSRSNE